MFFLSAKPSHSWPQAPAPRFSTDASVSAGLVETSSIVKSGRGCWGGAWFFNVFNSLLSMYVNVFVEYEQYT